MLQIELYKPLPEWSITPILNTEAPSVRSFLGKPLLILFFSVGCPGCLGRAIPYANRIVYEKGDQIDVLGIHSQFEQKTIPLAQFKQLQEELYIRFPFFEDDNKKETFTRYGAGGTPHWILLDAQGIVQYSIFGSDPNNALLRLDLKINEVLEGN